MINLSLRYLRCVYDEVFEEKSADGKERVLLIIVCHGILCSLPVGINFYSKRLTKQV